MADDSKFISDQGFILRMVEVKDQDGIVTIYTKEHGKCSAYVKGIKKNTSKLKQAGIIGTCHEFEFVDGKNMWTLRGVQPIFSIGSCYADIDNLMIIAQMMEIVDAVTIPGEETQVFIYELLKRVIAQVGQVNLWVLGKYFEWKMLNYLGYGANLSFCSACGQAFPPGRQRSIASLEGGFFCKNCVEFLERRKLIYFSEEDNAFLRFLDQADEKRLKAFYPTAALQKKMNIYFSKYWENILNYPLKSYDFIANINRKIF